MFLRLIMCVSALVFAAQGFAATEASLEQEPAPISLSCQTNMSMDLNTTLSSIAEQQTTLYACMCPRGDGCASPISYCWEDDNGHIHCETVCPGG